MDNQLLEINIENLKLDIYNPRLPKSKQGNPEEKIIIDWMLLEAATIELMTAIGQNDFFVGEQLLVVKDDENPGKYIVIEGNRRLTAVKLLSTPELANVKKSSINDVISTAKFKPQKIPCILFDKKKDILKYLGFRHITGIKSWRLLEKAKYLTDLVKIEFPDTPFSSVCRDLAKMIGSTSSYIRRLLLGYKLYQQIEDQGYFGIEGLNDTRFHLNYFVDSLNKEHIRNHINIDLQSENPLSNINHEHLKELTIWWFEKNEGKTRVIGDSNGLASLNSILGSENALKEFRNGSPIERALEYTDDLNQLFKREIQHTLRSIEKADQLSNRISEFYEELYDDLKNIRKIALKINDFKDQLQKEGDDF